MSGLLVRNRELTFKLLAICIPLVFSLLLYFTSVVVRSLPIYRNIKESQRGWTGKTFKADPELGFTSVPGARGSETAPLGPPLQMRFDEHGFRVPVNEELAQRNKRPLILFLGCSYTYGDLTPAEDTFAYLTGKALGGTSINAGIGSYGLSQMLVLGRKLIPQYKPDYVVIQYAYWLVDRSITPFAPTYYGIYPTPYFYEANGLRMQRPVFNTIALDLPTDDYQHTVRSTTDIVSFFFRVALPLFVHDDFNMGAYTVKKLFGMLPEPAQNKGLIIKSVYSELADVAKQHGAVPVIVVLGKSEEETQVPTDSFPRGVGIINAHDAQLHKLDAVTKESYSKNYYHWRGDPPQLIDSHPNKYAHKVISEAIVGHIIGGYQGK